MGEGLSSAWYNRKPGVNMMETTAQLFFTAPGEIEIRNYPVPDPDDDELLVRVSWSAISSGTEMLLYRGQFPDRTALDASIESLQGEFKYPFRYGYCSVGKVVRTGNGVDQGWIGKRVFSFQPHQSHFTARPEAVLTIPDGISDDEAVFLANMETAVNFLQDGAPLLGEDVVVFGQGIVGLLTTSLLSIYPLKQLITLDRHPVRRKASQEAGAHLCLDPANEGWMDEMSRAMPAGADLVFELTGTPETLNAAIEVCGFASRIVVGSWYGRKQSVIDLGGHFHRNRIRILSSQVSSIAPELRGRWDKNRRFDIAWALIDKTKPSKWITHRFPIKKAHEAYSLLDQHPEEAIQVILTYS